MKYVKWILRIILFILSVLVFLVAIEKAKTMAFFSLVMMLTFTFLSTHPLGLNKPQFSKKKMQEYKTGVFLLSAAAFIAGVSPIDVSSARSMFVTGILVVIVAAVGIKFIVDSKNTQNAA